MGVFGSATIKRHGLLLPRPYASTINKPNLLAIEQSLKSLWSPLWPEEALGAIDMPSCARGELLFKANCVECHNAIDRTDPNRKVTGTSPTRVPTRT